jgi:hypothetical protein
VALGHVLDGGVDVAHGGDVKVGDVHADLSAAVGKDSDGFDPVEAAVGGAYIAGDGSGGGDVGLLEVDVIGDEEAAGSDGRGTGGFVKIGTADVGAAAGIAAGSVAKAFELAAADVFEKDTVGAGGGSSVEVDGDAVATPDEKAGLAGEDGALSERGAADGDEGDDVGGADAGVDAALRGEVDEFGGFAGGAGGCFDDARGRAGDGDDGAVVRRVEGPVEKTHAVDLHGGDDLPDLGRVGAFREVRDTLDDGFWGHDSRVREWWLLFPPGVAEGELDAGVDAGVAVSEGGAGDVDAVGAEVDGTVRVDKVVDADASLGGEVEDAGVGVGAVVLRVVGWAAEGRVFVVGPEEAASCLSPEGETFGADYVPAEDDGGDGGSGVGAAYGVGRGALLGSAGRVSTEGALELGRVGLPEGEGLDGVFEVAAEETVAHVRSEDLAGVNTCHDELEAVAVFGEAEAALNEGADLQGLMAGGVSEGSGVIADGCLSGGEARKGEQESECPDGGRSEAWEVLCH